MVRGAGERIGAAAASVVAVQHATICVSGRCGDCGTRDRDCDAAGGNAGRCGSGDYEIVSTAVNSTHIFVDAFFLRKRFCAGDCGARKLEIARTWGMFSACFFAGIGGSCLFLEAGGGKMSAKILHMVI